ncbi:MAG TPA: outer membrane beta-barrel protein [Ignavibacteria bacterium]|nr:outer membrane beta-barrel protein [Ignavibacteria bacterium]
MKTTKQSLAVFATVLFLLVSGNLFAQKTSKFGIKGGLVTSRIITNNDDLYFTTYSRLGFDVYLSYDFFTNQTFVLSGETGFDQKGFKSDFTLTGETGDYLGTTTISSALNFLDISVNAKYMMRGKSASPYFSLTPTLGVYLGHSDALSGYINDEIQSEMFVTAYDDITDSLNSVSFGVKVGLGVEVNEIIKNVPLIFEVRWNPDLTQAFDNYGFKLKNTAVEFNLGVKF